MKKATLIAFVTMLAATVGGKGLERGSIGL